MDSGDLVREVARRVLVQDSLDALEPSVELGVVLREQSGCVYLLDYARHEAANGVVGSLVGNVLVAEFDSTSRDGNLSENQVEHIVLA